MSAPEHDRAGLPSGYPLKPEFEVTPRAAREMLAAGAVLIDVRGTDEWRLAHIEGSVLIPLNELESRISEIERLAAQGPIITHCHMGVRSMKAALFLRQRGFDDARSLAGGIEAWSAGVDPGVPRYGRAPTGGWRPLT